jgi:hypothetical protein
MPPASRSEKVALWWINSSVVWALAIFVVVALRSAQAPGVPSVRTPSGLILWASAALGALGVAGAAVSRRRPQVGAALLLAYSLLWAAMLAYGLTWVWTAGAEWSMCLKGVNVCITAWWARGVFAGGLAVFVLNAGWFWGRVRNGLSRA